MSPARDLLGPEATQHGHDVGRGRLAVLERTHQRVRDLGPCVQGQVREDRVDVDGEELAHPFLQSRQEELSFGERGEEATLVTRA